MCNLSDYVEARTTKRGMEHGRESQLIDFVVGSLRRGRSYEQVADSLLISVAEVKRLEQKALTPA